MCWLLGLRAPDQLRRHLLRGAVFETWVVSEVVKHRANAGERGGVYFCRAQNGVEADLLVERTDETALVEAKAGQTVTRDMLSPAVRIGETLSEVAGTRPYVVYGGDSTQQRQGAGVLPWKELHTQAWVNGNM